MHNDFRLHREQGVTMFHLNSRIHNNFSTTTLNIYRGVPYPHCESSWWNGSVDVERTYNVVGAL
jgi:hypothetical protein